MSDVLKTIGLLGAGSTLAVGSGLAGILISYAMQPRYEFSGSTNGVYPTEEIRDLSTVLGDGSKIAREANDLTESFTDIPPPPQSFHPATQDFLKEAGEAKENDQSRASGDCACL